jgi:hypothetical protein
MRAALSKAAQAQRLYDSPGMRAALDSAAQTRLHDSPAARALTQLAEHAAEVTSQVDPDQLRALAEAARGAFSPVSVARVLDPDPGVRREPPLALPPAERGTE